MEQHNIFQKGTFKRSFFFQKEKRQQTCNVILKVVLSLSFLFFFSIKNLSANRHEINAQCTLSCNGQTTITLDATGQFLITPATILSNPVCDVNNLTVEITDVNGNVIGNTLNCSNVNNTYNANLINMIDGNSCWGTITVKDNLAPTMLCQDLFVFCYENAEPTDIGYPTVTDNCTNITPAHLSYSDDFTDLPCYHLQNGEEITAQIERTWTATDEQGNSTTCTQFIYFKRVTPTDVVFPINKDDFESPSLNCDDDPTDLTITGEPTINGFPITINGLCELAVSYTDQQFPICGGAYQIIRTWTVVDWCSSEFILDAQVIKVLDTTAPVISCPNDITVGTTNTTCNNIVTLPQATATDDCSDVSISASWSFGNGFGPFTDVPLGTYPVTYSAEDACGNISTCTINVTVEDSTLPVAVCETQVVASLLNDGFSIFYATSINNGSYDNCGIDRYEISRDGVNFSEFILLDCSDASIGLLPVTLRVYDVNGNYNDCNSSINVIENIAPTLVCPFSVTIHCTDDLLDLALTGEASAVDNCGLDTLYFSDENNINSCGEGTVNRTWTATDIHGNMTSCIQIIQVIDNTPLTIQFPEDIDLEGCASMTTPDITGTPITNEDCESLGITFDDVEFENDPSLCIKILRTWTVVNWCQYEPNNPNSGGYETYTQVIKVIDDGSSATVSVAGVISNETGNMMSSVNVLLESGSTSENITCTDGVYELLEIESSDELTVTPTRDGDDTNGVTTIDMVFIQRHILGMSPLNSPYKMIAADVNRSGSITTFDMVLMRRLILQNDSEFMANTSWRFVDASFVFTNPANPFLDNFPEFISINPEVGEEYNFDFVAIKVGDVNGNANTD